MLFPITLYSIVFEHFTHHLVIPSLQLKRLITVKIFQKLCTVRFSSTRLRRMFSSFADFPRRQFKIVYLVRMIGYCQPFLKQCWKFTRISCHHHPATTCSLLHTIHPTSLGLLLHTPASNALPAFHCELILNNNTRIGHQHLSRAPLPLIHSLVSNRLNTMIHSARQLSFYSYSLVTTSFSTMSICKIAYD